MRNLLNQFRGMTQVADLGTHPTKLEWLAFHVPQGGTGQLQLEVTGTQHAAVQLKVMGLGGGSGRTFTFGSERDLGTRDMCFALGAWIDVRLRTFRGREDDAPEELRVDVEAVTNSYVEPLLPCALCFTDAARRSASRSAPGSTSASGRSVAATTMRPRSSGSTSRRSPTPTSSRCCPARSASPTLPVDLPERIRRAPAGT